jgi:peptidoglycan hydrolase-like protein with peptidoglycan-binding domain
MFGAVNFSAFHESYPNQSSQEVFATQNKLVQLGFVLDVTGSYDPATSAAVLAFRQKMSLPLVDQIDTAFVTALDMQGRPEFRAAWPGPKGGGSSMGKVLAIGAGVALVGYVLSKR